MIVQIYKQFKNFVYITSLNNLISMLLFSSSTSSILSSALSITEAMKYGLGKVSEGLSDIDHEIVLV